ncbi:hypothetical protein V8E53_012229 [Lactarius tabidus]
MAFTGPRVCGVERFRPITGTIVCPNPRQQTPPFSETSGRCWQLAITFATLLDNTAARGAPCIAGDLSFGVPRLSREPGVNLSSFKRRKTLTKEPLALGDGLKRLRSGVWVESCRSAGRATSAAAHIGACTVQTPRLALYAMASHQPAAKAEGRVLASSSLWSKEERFGGTAAPLPTPISRDARER